MRRSQPGQRSGSWRPAPTPVRRPSTSQPRTRSRATDVALVAMARAAAGDRPADLLPRLRAHTPGKLVNATIWTILALRQAGEPAPPALVSAVLAAQKRSGGWSWLAGSAADRTTRPQRSRRCVGRGAG